MSALNLDYLFYNPYSTDRQMIPDRDYKPTDSSKMGFSSGAKEAKPRYTIIRNGGMVECNVHPAPTTITGYNGTWPNRLAGSETQLEAWKDLVARDKASTISGPKRYGTTSAIHKVK